MRSPSGHTSQTSPSHDAPLLAPPAGGHPRGDAVTKPRVVREPTEKEIQAQGVALYRRAGCTVVHLSQPRRTMQTPGIPDTKVYAPQCSQAWWHEWKGPRGKQSEAQRAFQVRAVRCGERYILGGLREAEDQLVRIGLARRDNGVFILTPKSVAA